MPPDLNERLNADTARQASASLAGYMFQVWHSLLEWLHLDDDEALELEGNEDIDRLRGIDATTIQVKHLDPARSITLRSPDVLEAIGNFWTARSNNPRIRLRFRFLSTADAGFEAGNPFDGAKGLALWRATRRNTDPAKDLAAAASIRSFLIGLERTPSELREWLSAARPDEVLNDLIKPVEWDLGVGDLNAVREAVEERLVLLGNRYGFLPSESRKAIGGLLDHVATKASAKTDRFLNRSGLLTTLEQLVAVSVSPSELRLARAGQSALNAAAEAALLAATEKFTGLNDKLSAVIAMSNGDALDGAPVNPSDVAIQAQIDVARDLLRIHQPKTALKILQSAEEKFWNQSSSVGRFRLLANRASAHINLGDVQRGIECSLEAVRHAPDDPRAVVHAATAHFLGNDLDVARRMLDGLLATSPDNGDAVALRILVSVDEDDRDDPYWLVPDASEAPWNVHFAAARWFRHREKLDLALLSYRSAHAANPDNLEVAAELAITLLKSLFADEEVVFGRLMTDAQRAEFDWAVAVLRCVWDKARGTEAAKVFVVVAANLYTAFRYRGDLAGAEVAVDQGLAVSPADIPLLRDKALLLAGQPGRDSDVLATLDKLTVEDPQALILRANALGSLGRMSDAFSALDRVPPDAAEEMLVMAGNARARLLADGGHSDKALDEARRLTKLYPANPLAFLALSDVLQHVQRPLEARDAAHNALALTNCNPGQVVFTRLIVAYALYALEDWEGCADALASFSGFNEDSHPLELRVIALLRSGRRQELEELLSALPDQVARLPTYTKAAAWLCRAVGDYEGARAHLDLYVASVPGDLRMRLIWMDCIERLGDENAIKAFLDNNTSLVPNGSGTRDTMALAQALARHGFRERALELGYRTLRACWLQAKAHLGYMGLMLMNEQAHGVVPSPVSIGPDVAFTVRDDAGRLHTYTVETEAAPDAAAGEISPASPLALRAFGLRAGDTIQVHDSTLKPPGIIVEVKHKYVAMYHRILRHFNEMFPDETGMMSFDTDPADPGRFLEQIRPLLSARATRVETLVTEYGKGVLPMCFIKDDPIDAWSLLVGRGVQIDVCDGSEDERKSALGKLEACAGIILDPLACWIAGKIGVLDALQEKFGRLALLWQNNQGGCVSGFLREGLRDS